MLGVVICIPFIWRHPAVHIATDPQVDYRNGSWTGTLEVRGIPHYVDLYLLLMLGGIPWQVYFQRVLAAKSVRVAQVLSVIGGLGCIVMAIPCVVLGIAARYTAMITYFTPAAVSFFGLGAVAAAVMSSSDSSLLSSSSMLSNNIWKGIVRPTASSKEVIWVWRCGVLIFGTAGAVMGIFAENVYSLFYLCSDLVYVILFPQLALLVYGPCINRVGYMSGYLVALLFRLLSGESAFRIPPILKWPLFEGDDKKWTQKFPIYTTIMLINLVVTILVSLITNKLLPSHITRKGYTFENAADLSRSKYSDKNDYAFKTPSSKKMQDDFKFHRTVSRDILDPQYEVHELSVNYH